MKLIFVLLVLCSDASAEAWSKREITYSTNVPKRFLSTLDSTFKQWSVSGLCFKRVKKDGDIKILWSKHKEISFFLAYTSWTTSNGFLTSATITVNNKDYVWHVGLPWGVQLRYTRRSVAEFTGVILHEEGHALGLPHSDNPEDTMYWIIYAGAETLSDGDIKAIKNLYPTVKP